MKTLIIPDGTTEIEDGAYSARDDFECVKIPGSVKRIGKSAFHPCRNLTKVILEDGVLEIDDMAFFFSPKLQSVTIPSSVTRIGQSAFYNCPFLDRACIPEKLFWVTSPTEDGEGVIIKGTTVSIKTLVIPSMIEGKPVKEIGAEAFAGCWGLTSVSIPDTVTKIGTEAFATCKNLKYATLPKKLTRIEDGTFQGCNSLERISHLSALVEIGARAFWSCENLTMDFFPSGLTSVGRNAFSECSKLKVPLEIKRAWPDAFLDESLVDYLFYDFDSECYGDD